jgi:hypothetical protein
MVDKLTLGKHVYEVRYYSKYFVEVSALLMLQPYSRAFVILAAKGQIWYSIVQN